MRPTQDAYRDCEGNDRDEDRAGDLFPAALNDIPAGDLKREDRSGDEIRTKKIDGDESG